jgi:hypothetical protein
MAGYSGTPLPKKLGIKDNFRVAFHNLPTNVAADLKESLSACTVFREPTDALDFVMLFAKGRDELLKRLSVHSKHLAPAGMLWVIGQRKVPG